jgi:predicted nucleic acid-binding protein
VSDEGSTAVRCHYWDASALVKIVADDDGEARGRQPVRDFFFGEGLHYTTSYCLAEVLSAFKLKWLRELVTQEEYFRTVREFFRLVACRVTVDDVPVVPSSVERAERLMADHELDFIDAIQVVTLLHGQFAVFVGESRSLFVTADESLAKAARQEGAIVWLCTAEQAAP